MSRRHPLLLAAIIILAGCSDAARESRYVRWLYEGMSFADSVSTDRAYWEENVKSALQARREAPWKVPEREFLHYVLPVRVNNEPLDRFRIEYGEQLRARVKGLSEREAALEINHWCHEMATYAPSDGRTCSPLQTIRRKLGRCGEESVLAVAALRAVGIPARQVYTPRWAHTDDNHAWVEVFVDGQWCFMGACEPAPVLNQAWFNAPVSRAMLLHTRAFSRYDGPEDIIGRYADHTEINVTGSYVDTHRCQVQVLDSDGSPVEGADVRFLIYNYAELYPAAHYVTGSDGMASLTTGRGDAVILASKDGRYGIKPMNGSGSVTLDHSFGGSASFDMHIVPPVENPIPSTASPGQAAECAMRLAREDSLRLSRPSDGTVAAFLETHGDDSRARALVTSLSAKDRQDVTKEVLEDALEHCGKVFLAERDCPRVELEQLVPYFSEIRAGMDSLGLSFGSCREVRSWVEENIRVDGVGNPRHLRIPPVYVWRSRMADPLSRDIFYVALCRTAGLGATYDSTLGQVAEETGEQTARIRLEYEPLDWLQKPLYYRHFTLSRLFPDGSASLIALPEERDWSVEEVSGMDFESGSYLLCSGVRMADGSVRCHLELFEAGEGETVSVPLVLRRAAAEELPVIGSFDADPFLPLTGRGNFMIAVLGEGDEPSVHARRQLEGISSALEKWGRPVLLYSVAGAGRAAAAQEGLPIGSGMTAAGENGRVGNAFLPGVKQLEDKDCIVAAMLDGSCEGGVSGAEAMRLPLVAVCDSFGRVFYLSRGYNTSLAGDLESVIARL